MLTFVGLGLYDLEDISAKGLKAVRSADLVYLEAYTSLLTGTSPEEMALSLRERTGCPEKRRRGTTP